MELMTQKVEIETTMRVTGQDAGELLLLLLLQQVILVICIAKIVVERSSRRSFT
jgi:hypothetical protein